MPRCLFIALFALLLAVSTARPVMAEQGVQEGHTQTEPGVGPYYHIYTRQVDYMRENVKFRRDLETRSSNYRAMREEVLQRHENNLKASHGNDESEQSGSPTYSEDETAGPPVPDAAGLNP